MGKAETDYQLDLLDQLAIGDNVTFALEDKNPIIKGITVRRSKLARLRMDTSKKSVLRAEEHIIAANIDIAVIVASTVQPPFNPNLVDRYLVISQYGNVSPLLCITKTDLAKAPDLSMYESTDLPVVKVSNMTKDGVDRLLPYIKGKICVMIGSSGVGKSSLINSLCWAHLLRCLDCTLPTLYLSPNTAVFRVVAVAVGLPERFDAHCPARLPMLGTTALAIHNISFSTY